MPLNVYTCPTSDVVPISARDAAYIAGARVSRLASMVEHANFPPPLNGGKKPVRFDFHEVLEWSRLALETSAACIRSAYETKSCPVFARVMASRKLDEIYRANNPPPVSNVIYPTIWHKSSPTPPQAA